jgi:hypothetical protein
VRNLKNKLIKNKATAKNEYCDKIKGYYFLPKKMDEEEEEIREGEKGGRLPDYNLKIPMDSSIESSDRFTSSVISFVIITRHFFFHSIISNCNSLDIH